MLTSSRDKRISHIILSALLCALWAALGMAYFHYSSISFPEFGLALFIIYSLAIGVASGLIAMLLRVFNAIGNTSFLYRLIGVANIVLGLIGISILLFAEMEAIWLILFILCWVVGLFVLNDIFRHSTDNA